MREIPLTRGKVALVDDEDYESVAALKWYAERRSDILWYAARNYPKKIGRGVMRMHAFIMGETNRIVSVDHISCDGLDNRRSNLRWATGTQQQGNKRKSSGASSQFKGVSWHKRLKVWRAQIHVDRRYLHLGHFDSEEQAAMAYDAAALTYFGEFAKLNMGDLNAL